MTTETAETEQTEAPPEDLKAEMSATILERRDALSRDADAALDSDDWGEYEKLSEAERVLTAELDRRRDSRAKKTPAPATVIDTSATERMDALRARITEGEAALEKFQGFVARGNTPPPMGETAEETDTTEQQKVDAFTNLEALKQELAAIEMRLPYADQTDDGIVNALEDAQISVESLRADVKRFQADNKPAAERKAARLLEEATGQWLELEHEAKVRKQIRTREGTLDQLARFQAANRRQENLAGWRARLTELEADLQTALAHPRDAAESVAVRHLWVDSLAEAHQSIEAHEKAIANNAPFDPAGVATLRAVLDAEAPRISGTW